MKICLIGCGGMADGAYGPSFEKYRKLYGNIEFSACCDVNFARAESIKNKFGFQSAYTDINQALIEVKPDVVFSAVSEQFAELVAISVLNAGIPLMMEKPPGVSALQAQNIAIAAEKKGTPNMVAFNRRHMQQVIASKERLLGRENTAYLHYEMVRMGRTDSQFAWTAVHAIDTVRFLAGSDYSTVEFTYMMLPDGHMENVLMSCVFKNGATAHIGIIPQGGVVIERLEAHTLGESFFAKLPVWGAYDAPGSFESIENGIQTKFSAGETEPVFESNGFYKEIETFLNCVKNDSIPKDSIQTAIQTMEVMEALAKHEKSFKCQL